VKSSQIFKFAKIGGASGFPKLKTFQITPFFYCGEATALPLAKQQKKKKNIKKRAVSKSLHEILF